MIPNDQKDLCGIQNKEKSIIYFFEHFEAFRMNIYDIIIMNIVICETSKKCHILKKEMDDFNRGEAELCKKFVDKYYYYRLMCGKYSI